MVKSLALGSSQIKAASEPPSWLGHLCDQTLTVRSSQLPSPWSAGNTLLWESRPECCLSLHFGPLIGGTLLGSERKPESILPTYTFPSCSQLGKNCLSSPPPKKKNPYYLFSHNEAVLNAGGSRQGMARVLLGTGRRRRSVVRC